MQTKQQTAKQQTGFTLIELIITIAVLTIIVAIAVPAYTNQVIRSNRTEAIDELLRQASFQQSQFTQNNQFSAVANYVSASGRYRITTVVGAGGQQYALTATPLGNQVRDACGVLTLTSIGRRTAGGNDQNCWAGRSQ